jgi:type III secretory pathway component EscV
MILPMPSVIIDTMVAFNLFIAIFILLATIDLPLRFSSTRI